MNDRELKENKLEPAKQPYNAPQLTTYGDVEELTRGGGTGVTGDGTSEPPKAPSH